MTSKPRTPRVLDVVIRSYFRDVGRLRACLDSLERYVSGHRRTVVVVPKATERRLDLGWIERNESVQLTTCQDFEDDYVGQQITKLHADSFTDADFVLLLDSDQRFTSGCPLFERVFDARGRLRQRVGHSGRRPRRDGWRQCAEHFFQRPFDLDLAGTLPLVVPRPVFAGLRAECLHRHGTTLSEYAVARSGDELCEVALLSGWMHLYAGESVVWEADCTRPLLPECMTTWSRSAESDCRAVV